MPLPLEGRHAVVTGASRGIGRAIAHVLAGAGAQVTLVARGMDELRSVAASIGPLAHAAVCDVTDLNAVTKLAQSLLAQSPKPDLLINNAGLFPLAPLDTMEPFAFEHTIRSNLVAPFFVLRNLLPEFKRQGRGHVVTIGSVADRTAFAGNGAYAASKYGQRAMHEILRQELQGTAVRSTLISPSATDTSIWDPIDPDNQPDFPSRSNMLRPADVAEAVLWAVTRPAHVNIDELRLSSC